MGLSQNGLLQNPPWSFKHHFPNEMAIFKHGAYAIPFLDNPLLFPWQQKYSVKNMAGMLNQQTHSHQLSSKFYSKSTQIWKAHHL